MKSTAPASKSMRMSHSFPCVSPASVIARLGRVNGLAQS